jgi:phage terminase small subunit
VKAAAVLADPEVGGHFVAGSMGQLVPHPALKTLRDQTVVFERLAQSVALTPVARSRLGLAVLAGQALAAEMDDAIGSVADALVDAEVVDDEVGVPGL